MIDIAVIFTCYNRREKTINCLINLEKQTIDSDITLSYYICDDNSSDGTVAAIYDIVPDATVKVSSGDLFWSRGMHSAMLLATEKEHDFYLMINDDLVMFDDCIKTMLDSYYMANCVCGIVGSTLGINEGVLTYGGQRYRRKNKVGPTYYVEPSVQLEVCDIANWNCFLIPQEVINKVGLIDNYYEHGLGDYDYCFMMRKNGIPIFVASKYVGRTDRNTIKNTYRDKSLKKLDRIRRVFSIKERPIRSEFHFYIKNFGFFGLFYFAFYYGKMLLGILIKPA